MPVTIGRIAGGFAAALQSPASSLRCNCAAQLARNDWTWPPLSTPQGPLEGELTPLSRAVAISPNHDSRHSQIDSDGCCASGLDPARLHQPILLGGRRHSTRSTGKLIVMVNRAWRDIEENTSDGGIDDCYVVHGLCFHALPAATSLVRPAGSRNP
jgi:hypothetical protein